MAYDECGEKLYTEDYSEYKFLNKYYNGIDSDWLDAKRWFGRTIQKETKLYLNEIAKSLIERLIPQYQYILKEMVAEGSKEDDQQIEKKQIGQKYLEYQLSWFGKKYCEDNDITYAVKDKAKKEFIAFLETYADNGQKIDKEEKKLFSVKFTKLYDAAFGRADRNLARYYGIHKMNGLLEDQYINYEIKNQRSNWRVCRCDEE